MAAQDQVHQVSDWAKITTFSLRQFSASRHTPIPFQPSKHLSQRYAIKLTMYPRFLKGSGWTDVHFANGVWWLIALVGHTRAPSMPNGNTRARLNRESAQSVTATDRRGQTGKAYTNAVCSEWICTEKLGNQISTQLNWTAKITKKKGKSDQTLSHRRFW